MHWRTIRKYHAKFKKHYQELLVCSLAVYQEHPSADLLSHSLLNFLTKIL